MISGTRSNGCIGIEVSQIDSSHRGSRAMQVRERVPCGGRPCTQALTNDFHFAKVCKEFLPFHVPERFAHKLATPGCAIPAQCARTVGG